MNDGESGWCENCRFFVMIEEQMGECRRYAPRPRVVAVATSQLEGYFEKYDSVVLWPTVDRSDECGEWRARNG